MTEIFKGREFLKKKFWKFEDFREAVKKLAQRKSGKKIKEAQPEHISLYIQRLIDVLNKPRGKDIFERVLKRFIIKPEYIAEQTIKNLMLGSLAEQMGYQASDLNNENIKKSVLKSFKEEYGEDFDSYKVPEDELKEKRKIIIEDQKRSLNLWFDYLTSPEAETYPSEFRYWVFAEILKLGNYDEERKKFNERTKTTIAPFPTLNQQALSLVLDELLRKHKGEAPKIIVNLSEEEKKDFLKRLESESFGDLYGWVLDYIKRLILPKERMPIIVGEWREFKNPQEAKSLVSQISNFPTNWCISAESTAESYLIGKNIYVYFSQDDKGKNTIPRLAIVINKRTQEITEIRGIDENQNLDPYIHPVLEGKLNELEKEGKVKRAKEYLRRVEDMKKIAEIHSKHILGQELTKEELKFLYEIDRKIVGFGYTKDPRIEEIKKDRNIKKDYATMFDCQKSQVALNMKELNEDVVVLLESFEGIQYKKNELPLNLKYILGNAFFENSQIESLGNLEKIGGSADFTDSNIKDLGKLTRIGGDAYFENSQIESLGNLEEIGWDAYFRNSNIKDLGKLRRIGRITIVSSNQQSLIEKLRERGFRLEIR